MVKFVVLMPLLALGACGVGSSQASDASPAGTRTFTVGSFTAVSLEGSDDVRVVRGPAVAVVASGPKAVLDKLHIRVEGTTLKVSRKRGNWSMGYDKGAVVTVTMPTIGAASIAGSGDMSIDRVAGAAFDGSVAGSGNLRLTSLQVQRAKLAITGSGDLQAVGASGDVALSSRGSGDIDAAGLATKRATISTMGSGNVRAAASESAAISMAGSGDVSVTGTDRCTISKAGSGEATCSR